MTGLSSTISRLLARHSALFSSLYSSSWPQLMLYYSSSSEQKNEVWDESTISSSSRKRSAIFRSSCSSSGWATWSDLRGTNSRHGYLAVNIIEICRSGCPTVLALTWCRTRRGSPSLRSCSSTATTLSREQRPAPRTPIYSLLAQWTKCRSMRPYSTSTKTLTPQSLTKAQAHNARRQKSVMIRGKYRNTIFAGQSWTSNS